MSKFDVKQSDLTVEIRYTEPAFGLLEPGVDLHAKMFGALGEYELTAGDIRIQNDVTDLSRPNVMYSMPVYKAHVRVSLEKLEVLFLDLAAVDTDQVQRITVAALRGLRESVPPVKLASYTIANSAHGTVEGLGATEFIRQFISQVPDGVGPLIGNGIVFYFGPEGDRQQSSLTLDMSLLFSQAIYVRAFTTFAGTLEPEVVAALANEYLALLFTKAGLEL